LHSELSDGEAFSAVLPPLPVLPPVLLLLCCSCQH
jgi:hypothetical protein